MIQAGMIIYITPYSPTVSFFSLRAQTHPRNHGTQLLSIGNNSSSSSRVLNGLLANKLEHRAINSGYITRRRTCQQWQFPSTIHLVWVYSTQNLLSRQPSNSILSRKNRDLSWHQPHHWHIQKWTSRQHGGQMMVLLAFCCRVLESGYLECFESRDQ